MDHLEAFVGRHVAPLIFAVVFLDQLGAPIPTLPVLLALGALAARGTIEPVSGIAVAVAASLCADLLWFQLGRRKGAAVLGFLCRASLEPDTCVSSTKQLYSRYGLKSLLVAKFVPGFDTVAPPLAAMLGVPMGRFALWSAGGALLWLGTFGGLGWIFADSLESIVVAAERLGGWLVWIVGALVAAWLGWKFMKRRGVLASLRLARITPDELRRRTLAGEELAILDVRDEVSLRVLPFVIPGSRLITFDQVEARILEIPRDREVVLACT